LFFTSVAAGLILLCPARESQAQAPQFSVGDLKAAFNSAPRLEAKQVGSEPYYDVVAEHICDSAVENLYKAWLAEWYARLRNRAIEIDAAVSFPDSKRDDLHSIIFIGGNTTDAGTACQSSVVRGVPRNQRVRVILQLIVVDQFGQRTSAVISGAVVAGIAVITTASTGGWGGLVVGVLGGVAGGATKAYASTAKNVTRELLKEGSKYPAHPVELGGDVQENKPNTVAAYFETNRQEVFKLSRNPRPQLLPYNPFFGPEQIPEEIDSVSANATWNQMLETAQSDAVDWSAPVAVNRFCGSFRRQLQNSLHYDRFAVGLGLYAHYKLYQGQFNADPDRASRGCLEAADVIELRKGIPTFSF
jgi:hypothetical protein